MTNNKQQTAVEWFIEQLEYKGDLRETPSIRNIQLNIDTSDYMELKVQAKEMEKDRMIQLVQALKDYTHESHTILGHDERDASEFVDIFYERNLRRR
jgi:hypothetical protein